MPCTACSWAPDLQTARQHFVGIRLAMTYRWARRIAVALIGGTVVLAGIAMVVLPGPAFVVIPVGLGILGLEFAWARRWLKVLKEKGAQVADGVRRAAKRSPAERP